MSKILIIDIERISGIVDGIWERKQRGYLRESQFIYKPRTICFAWKWLGEDDVQFIAEWDGDNPHGRNHKTVLHEEYPGHRRMIKKARDLLDEADYVVGWNSKKFDVKHLREHMIEYEMDPPSPHIDVDLILASRNQFGWLSHSLGAVSESLGHEGKLQHGGGELWHRLRFSSGDDLAEARELMREYNIQDVLQTEKVYYDLRPWVPRLNIVSVGDLPDYDDEVDRDVCRRCGSSNIEYRGSRRAQTYWYHRFVCRDCKGWGTGTRSYFHDETVSA